MPSRLSIVHSTTSFSDHTHNEGVLLRRITHPHYSHSLSMSSLAKLLTGQWTSHQQKLKHHSSRSNRAINSGFHPKQTRRRCDYLCPENWHLLPSSTLSLDYIFPTQTPRRITVWLWCVLPFVFNIERTARHYWVGHPERSGVPILKQSFLLQFWVIWGSPNWF